MPIKIADGLSAKEKLHEEGIFTIDKGLAPHQDIRPLRILILNLMPLKKPTELQLLRLLGDSPLQVEVDFCHTDSHESTHTDPSYLEENYYVFDEIKDTTTTVSSSPAPRSNRFPSSLSTTGRK